jgi:O-antigen/teichoic acid export membrane protein
LGDLDERYGAVALAIVGVLVYVQSFPSLMTGTDRAPVSYRVRALFAVVNTTAIATLWLVGWLSVDAMIILLSASWIAQAMLELVLVATLHRGRRLRPTAAGIGSSLSYGLRLYPGFIANWLHLRLDQLVIAHVIGVSGVGLYALSVRWVEMLWFLGYGLLHAGLFRIASSGRDDSREFSWRLFRLTLLVTGLAGFGLAVVAYPLITFLYGPEFEGAIAPMLVLVPGVVLWDASRVLSTHIAYNLGRPHVPALVAVCAMVINLAATLVAVPHWGLIGAAGASTLTYSLVFLIILVAFRRMA